MFKNSLKLCFLILGMTPGPEKAAPNSLQNIWTGGHFFCYFGSSSIMAYQKAWLGHTDDRLHVKEDPPIRLP